MNPKTDHQELVIHTIESFWKTIPPLWHYTRSVIHRTAREDFGITSTQYQILRRINDRGRRTVSELSDCMFVSRPSISRAVEELVTAGLAVRECDPQDRRVMYLSLTDKGKELILQIYTKNNLFMHEMFSTLEDPELENVCSAFELLEKILIINSQN